MNSTPPHLGTLEEIEETGIPGLVEVLREESLDAVRYVLWDATGWHRDYRSGSEGIRTPDLRRAKADLQCRGGSLTFKNSCK